jgi:hypothetical protein
VRFYQSTIDVEVGEFPGAPYGSRIFVRHDSLGGTEPFYVDAAQPEELRYYSKTNEFAAATLLKINPYFGKQRRCVLTFSIEPEDRLDECFWCCKVFPEGMKQCSGCSENVYYCDEQCQRKAWKVHRWRDVHCNDSIEKVD